MEGKGSKPPPSENEAKGLEPWRDFEDPPWVESWKKFRSRTDEYFQQRRETPGVQLPPWATSLGNRIVLAGVAGATWGSVLATYRGHNVRFYCISISANAAVMSGLFFGFEHALSGMRGQRSPLHNTIAGAATGAVLAGASTSQRVAVMKAAAAFGALGLGT
ncbi:unnamed protein product, partial [Chrysoparadoxa australica]